MNFNSLLQKVSDKELANSFKAAVDWLYATCFWLNIKS